MTTPEDAEAMVARKVRVSMLIEGVPQPWRSIIIKLRDERDAAEARLTALEADRVKVAETARIQCLAVAQQEATNREELGDMNGKRACEAVARYILAITPAAVLAQVEKP